MSNIHGGMGLRKLASLPWKFNTPLPCLNTSLEEKNCMTAARNAHAEFS